MQTLIYTWIYLVQDHGLKEYPLFIMLLEVRIVFP